MNTVNNTDFPNSYKMGPDNRGRFGEYGGRFVSENVNAVNYFIRGRI